LLNLKNIDTSWTLFLDRDGVINVEKKDAYVLNSSEFIFLDGVFEALRILAETFGLILIVSNQRGVAKQLMTLDDLKNVHDYMMNEIIKQEGRIDKIYFCTDLDNTSPNRKPNPGMALQAKKEFTQINFDKSVMAGNKLTDMQFARNAGIHAVFIASTNPEIVFPHELIDARFDSLLAFAEAIHH